MCGRLGHFFESLGAVGSIFGKCLEPLGQLGNQKYTKGAPKANKKLPKVTKKETFLEVVCITGIYKKCKKTVPKKHLLETSTSHRKCLQSVAPATLLDVAARICTGFYCFLHNAFCSRLPYFGSFFTLQRPEKTSKKHSKRSPQMDPDGGGRRL